jgi:hypothetical protein
MQMSKSTFCWAVLVNAALLFPAWGGDTKQPRPVRELPSADAFLWLVPNDKESVVHVYFGDGPAPTVLPRLEKNVVLVRHSADKTETAECRESDDKKSCIAEVPGKGIRWLGAETIPQVMQPEGKKPYLVKCYAAALLGYTPHLAATTDAPKEVSTPCNRFPLEVVVTEEVALILRVYWRGKPLTDPKVAYRASGWKGWAKMHVAQETPGLVYDQVPQGNAGIVAVRVTHIEVKQGEHEGKKYEEIHHRATLLLRVVDSDRR